VGHFCPERKCENPDGVIGKFTSNFADNAVLAIHQSWIYDQGHVPNGIRMKKIVLLICFITIAAIGALYPPSARARTKADIYNNIDARPSTIRWCLPEAGDDPAHIIGGRCEVYRECLAHLSLDESVDRTPFPSLAGDQIDSVRKCHQALFNGARTNPQLKGSGATQQWLQHSVHPGTEAKSFSVPSNFANPR
jgi:hypothetical protein